MICLPPSNKPVTPESTVLAFSVISELMQFGFVPTAEAQVMLTSASKEDVVQFHNEVVTYLKDITGAKRSYKPFWKGFPTQVMEMTEVELWMHQIVHYWSNGEYTPSDWTKERPTAFEQPKYTMYGAGTEEDFLNIFKSLVSVNQSLTPEDLADVKWFASNVPNLPMPSVIPFKETLCTLASLGLNVPVKTVTDVLRIAVALSGGDVSLPKVPNALVKANAWTKVKVDNPEREKFKFRKFKRSERQYLLGLLESTNCDASEAVLKLQRWIRLGELLHPGDYRRQFPKSYRMFAQLRNEKIQSWYGKVEDAFKSSLTEGLSVLGERPGEFLRKFDFIVRSNPTDTDKCLNALGKVSDKVSNKVLFESYAHFEDRTVPATRSVMVKGARKRTKLEELPALPATTVQAVQSTILSSLSKKFSKLPSLGSTWIDENLKLLPVPANMRSLNAALKPTIRGQRTPIGNQNAKVIRAYVHWFDENGREDLDLSSSFVGMGKIEHISWNTNLKHRLGCHSGDVRHVKGACAEYVDIDVQACKKEGFKYVVMTVNNFNGRGLDTMKDCVFGYMEREFPAAQEIFVPATLANSVKLQSTSTNTLVAVIDVETQEYIFLDIDTAGIPVATANVNAMLEAIKPYCEPPKFSVYDLLVMHTNARGKLVTDESKAETVFKYDDFANSYVETLALMGV